MGAPAPDTDTRAGVTQSITDALVDVMREGRQLATGNALDPNQNIPAPVQRTPMGGMAYGLAHGAPTLASMVLGGLGGAEAGTAVAPGPGTAVGAVAGGALGGGLMDFAQNLTPAYQQARQRGLNHDQAVDEAYGVAASSGALTGATAPLFALKVFKAPISNFLLHAFGTQPAIGAVHRGVITPAVTGQPAPSGQDMLEGYLQDVATGGATMGAMHAGPAISNYLRRPGLDVGPPPPPPPGPGQLPGPRQPTPFGDMLRPGEVAVTPGQPEPYPPSAPVEPPPASVAPPWRREVPGVAAAPTPPAPVEPTPSPGTPQNAPTEPTPIVPGPVAPGAVAPTIPEPPTVTPAPAGPTGAVPVAPGPEPVVPEPGQPPAPGGLTPPVPTPPAPVATPSPGEQPGTETGTTPEPQPLAGGTQGEVPPAPPPPEQSGAAQTLARLDAEKAPDEAYRAALSTSSKEPLKPGETWRDRLVRVAESQRPVETPPAEPTPAPTPAPAPAEPPAAAASPPAPAPSGKRPVTEGEQTLLQADLNKARRALDNAIRTNAPPEKIEALKQRVATTGAALDNAEGPPTKPMFIKAPPGSRERHEAAVKAHQEAVDLRVHNEGTTPVPEPKAAGKVFTMGAAGGQGANVVRLTDPAGNQWVGTGNAITRESTLGKAARQVEKLKTSVTRTLPPEAFTSAIAIKPGVDRHPVTWERAVTDTDGRSIVIGTLPSGKHVTLQKPVYDTLHAAAGKDGTITAADSKNDQRVFAHDAKGEFVGVGMPMNYKQDIARTYARGAETPGPSLVTAPVEHPVEPTPAPAPAPVPAPAKPTKATKPAPPATRTVDARDLKPGDTIRTPKGEHLKVISIERDKLASVLATVEGRKKPLNYAPRKEVNVLADEAPPPATLESTPLRWDDDPRTQNHETRIPRELARSADQISPKDMILENLDRGGEISGVIAPDGRLYVFHERGESRYDFNITHQNFAEDFPGHNYAEVSVYNGNHVGIRTNVDAYTPAQLRTISRIKAEATRQGGETQVSVPDDLGLDTDHPTELEARYGGTARPQRRAPTPPGERHPLPTRYKPIPAKPLTPVPGPGEPLTMADIAYSPGAPRYQDAYHDALAGTGVDPRTAMNKPLDEQVQMLSRALQNKYSFGRVIIDPGVDLRITRDQLLNMHHNMQGMAHAMNWPNAVLSLDGRLNLMLVPRNFNGSHWMGMYAPATKTIHVSGGSNSYAHEHWHAVDQYLSDMLNNNPNKATLFTHAARHDQLIAADPVQASFANLLNTIFYGDGEVGLRRLTLETTAAKIDPATGRPTVGALLAREQIRKLDNASSRLHIPPSPFRLSAANMPNPEYFASAHELFARAGEAYTAWAMEAAGTHTEGVVKSDAGYQNQLIAYLKAAYPNAQDRVRIFQAFGDLRTELERASILPLHGAGALPPSDQHTLPPGHTRPPDIGPGLVARIKADMRAIKWSSLFSDEHGSLLFPEANIEPPLTFQGGNTAVRQSLGVRQANWLAEHWNSTLGNMERWIEQIPPGARPPMRELRDRLGYRHGEGQYIAETFEGRARRYAQKDVARFADIMRDGGFTNKVGRLRMTAAEKEELVHTLTTGDKVFPLDRHDIAKQGQTRPIPDKIIRAAQLIRQDIFNATYDRLTKANLPIGHTKEGYYPRMMNDAKILSDPSAFIDDMTRINRLVQENDFADAGEPDAQRLAHWWTNTGEPVRDNLPISQAAQDAMSQLVRNIREINRINAELASGGASNPTAHDPQKLMDRRDTLEAENQDIHDTHGEAVLQAIARAEAEHMNHRITLGEPHDLITLGPRAEFLRKRTLPPEADQILRNWYVNDPMVAIPMYLHAASRKLAYHEVFGPKGRDIQELLRQATVAGMHGIYVKRFREAVETITGRSGREKAQAFTEIANAISGVGALMTMSGASISALGEPAATVLNGGSFRMMLNTYSNLMGQAFHTASAAERMLIARQIGAIIDPLQGAAMANRGSDYSGTPMIGTVVNNFYELIMSPVIRNIRAATLGAGNQHMAHMLDVIDQLESKLKGTTQPMTRAELDKLDDMKGLLREWGMRDRDMARMREWMRQFPDGQPTPDAIATTPEGEIYQVLATRMLDRFNANPTAAEKPMGAMKTSYGNMMLGLTSFPYTFFRQSVLPLFHKFGAKGQRQYDRAKARGASNGEAWREAKGAQFRHFMHAAVSVLALTAGTALFAIPRAYLFNHDAWEKHAEEGDLKTWLWDYVVSQTGINGPLEIGMQALNSLRYTSDLSNLVSGPFLASELRYAIDVLNMVKDVYTGDSRTNTRVYNGIHALLQLGGKPAALTAMTWLMQRLPAGGPLATLLAGASVAATSTTATRGITTAIAGPKGSELPKPPKPGELPPLPGLGDLPPLPSPGGETKADKGGAGGGVLASTAGAIDDILMPLIKNMPPTMRTLVVGAAVAGTSAATLFRAREFATHGKPPEKVH
jgi:hypothetical protein